MLESKYKRSGQHRTGFLLLIGYMATCILEKWMGGIRMEAERIKTVESRC